MALSLASLMLMSFLLALPAAGATTPVFIKVEGRTVVSVLETNEYLVTAMGGPGSSAGGNYSYLISISGNQISDALVSPADGNSSTGIFHFNLTSPSVATDMTLLVNVTSEGSNGERAYAEYKYYVRSVIPVAISAKVVNLGTMDLDNVAIDIYADGQKLAQRVISLSAGASADVMYNWTESISAGKHEVRLELDPDSQYVRFESGGTVYTQAFWAGGNDYGNTDAILIGLIALLILVAYFTYKRPAAKRRKGK